MQKKVKLFFLLLLFSLINTHCGVVNFPEFSIKGDKPEPTSTDFTITQTAKVIEETEVFLHSKYIWFIDQGSLIQIDTENNESVSIGDLEVKAIDISAGTGSIWIADSETNQVIQLNPSTKEIINSYYIVQGQIKCITANERGVWIGVSIDPITDYNSASGGIIKIDHNMNEVVNLVHTQGVPIQIQIFDGDIWILEKTQSATLFGIFDLEEQVLSMIPEKLTSPNFVHNFSDFAIVDNSIWAIPFNEISNYIFRVDKFSGEVIQRFYMGENQNPVDIIAINNQIWVALDNGDVIIINPANDQVINRISVSHSLSDIYSSDEFLWLFSHYEAQISKIDPKSHKILESISVGTLPQAEATSTPRFRHEETGPTCQGADPPGLELGSVASVKSDPPIPNRVRVEPYNDSDILGEIEPGETMVVLEGPVCSTGWVWWKIQSEKDGLVGWTAEGDGGTIWLEKVE